MNPVPEVILKLIWGKCLAHLKDPYIFNNMNLRWSRHHQSRETVVQSILRVVQNPGRREAGSIGRRVHLFRIVSGFIGVLLVLQLFRLQVLDHRFYAALASGQHDIYQDLFPERGEIFVAEQNGELFPVAVNRDLTLVWADLRAVDNPTRAAKVLAEILGLNELELKTKLSRTDDPYEPIAHLVSDEQVTSIKQYELSGIGFRPEETRVYPERGFGGQVLGFLGLNENGERLGRYGLEGFYNELLRGAQGFLRGERDPAGRLIAVAGRAFEPAKDGADLILTIDRRLQFFVCEKLREAVEWHGADGGSVVVLNPKNGAVLAMCGAPDFDPNIYREVENAAIYNNPALFYDYEPGSVFKAITMAAALDTDAVGPQTTYVDEGLAQIGSHTIRNSDNKSYGVQTMTRVLEQSLNTGAIFAMRETGQQSFKSYVERFGFGEAAGIDLQSEVSGNTGALNEKGEIYFATASFGQGITVTPLQLVSAFASIANGGQLMRPYVVRAVREKDGVMREIRPEIRRQVVSERTAKLLSAMLTSVVERGHGKRAGVPGYYIAGKTGTAQIPKKDGPGYEPGAHIGSFIGFGPVEDPVFAMAVRIDRPRDVQFAESSAAPLFGKIAQFLLQYYGIPPTRNE